ncbi:hypothetical protein GIB67_004547 [Kingdonia uniflora]|uniref:Uncharacterized protein n=1 Tax=Kingdonia uniflora TaxID=39325 RepID=A0A7J7MKZ1_9MAGN|nr:hypothetical protein GIB67_004547 [Kingdonia uniflora]
MLEQILMSTVEDKTLPLGDTPLLGHYQFSTPEKTAKLKREQKKEEDRKGKKAEPRIKKDDDVEVGREVIFNAISSKYGDDLLEYVYPILQMEELKNGNENVDGDEKFDDVGEEEESEQPTAVVYYAEKKDVQPDNESMVVAKVAKIDIVFFNQEEAVGETSVDQTAAVSIKEQILEVEKTKDKASQLILVESEVDATSKKRHALTEEENNESAFKMACRMNQLHAHLDELLLGVLLEYFTQRPNSQDAKSQVDQVWSLRKDESTPEAKKGNRSTYMMIGH